MGRKNTIDRTHVLAVAEKIVREYGAAALTIDAVAKAAGITKGGVQSCFGTKEGLIEAMLGRWIEEHEQQVSAQLPSPRTSRDLVALHANLTFSDPVDAQRRVAGLLSVLLQSPTHLEQVRDWYRTKLEGVVGCTHSNTAELAFLATEGAFFLRYLGLVDYTDDQWNQIHKNIFERL